MGRNDHGSIFVIVVDDGTQDVFSCRRVHTGDGIVQQVELCLTAHDQNQLHLFLGALGHGLQMCGFLDAQGTAHICGLLPLKIRIKITEQVEEIFHLHPVGEVVSVRQIAYDGFGIRARDMSVDKDISGSRLKQTVQDLDQRRLAAPVWAQKADHLAAADVQIDLIQRPAAGKNFRQSLTFYDFTHFISPLSNFSLISSTACRSL